MTSRVSTSTETLYNSSDCDVHQPSHKNHKKKEGGKHGSAVLQKNVISYTSVKSYPRDLFSSDLFHVQGGRCCEQAASARLTLLFC